MATRHLPGMENDTIQELEDLADVYRTCRDKFGKAGEKFSDAREGLTDGMKRANRKTYRCENGDIIVRKPGKDAIKLTHTKTDQEKSQQKLAKEADE